MNKKVKVSIISIIVLLCLCAAGGYFYVQSVVSAGFGIDQTVYIEIDESKNYNDVLRQIEQKARVESLSKFEKVSDFLDYPSVIKSGRYAITPQMTVLEAVRLLKSGSQTPVKLKFNNIRTKEDLAERISQQLMMSKDELLTVLNDPSFCQKYGFNENTIISMFIPNTYDVYWNTSMSKFMDRMHLEYKSFWTDKRKEKAQALNLSPVEVSVLASIVEEECYFTDEYPVVAGLYLNRLKKGMKLQADPTVKFSVGDFAIKRVLNRHLEVDSPYNTYIYFGLPPGPIRNPSIKGIDSVLNYNRNDYLYMCAKEDFSGRHNFAKTHAEHDRNRIRYQAELNKRKIFQ